MIGRFVAEAVRVFGSTELLGVSDGVRPSVSHRLGPDRDARGPVSDSAVDRSGRDRDLGRKRGLERPGCRDRRRAETATPTQGPKWASNRGRGSRSCSSQTPIRR